MNPAEHTAMQPPVTLHLEHLPTPIGRMLLVCDEWEQLRALDWEDYASRMHRLLAIHYGRGGVRLVERRLPPEIRESLLAYLHGELTAIDSIPVETAGTAFQRSVWSELRRIPAGTTVSYGELAERIGRPEAVRAVGHANGSNPIGVVVPCHRVVGANGSLTGYGGGIERKRWLLQHERALPRSGDVRSRQYAFENLQP
jgi:methylated-DNA-[protein]-cysteine S-methyltransferase